MKKYLQKRSVPQIKFLLLTLLFLGGIKAQSQTTVTHVQQQANYCASFTSGSSGSFNQGSFQLGMYANTNGSKQSVSWRQLTTNGISCGSNQRSMQVGDQLVIRLSAARAYGRIGFALLASPTTGGSYANRESNYSLSVNLDGPLYLGGTTYGNWYIKYNGGATSSASFGGQQTNYQDFTMSMTLTAPGRMNVSITNNSTSITSSFYDVLLNTVNPITDYSIFLEDDYDGGTSRNIYWGLGATNQQHTVTDNRNLIIGQSNTSFTISDVLPDGKAADQTTGSVVNTLIKNGTGTVMLTGANSYTGQTTVNGGTLALNRAGGTTLPATNNITVNSGGILKISSNQQLGAVLINNGGLVVIDPGVTLTAASITGNGTMMGSPTSGLVITGTGSFLSFDQTSPSTRSLNNFSLNAGSSATLASSVDIYGALSLTTASLDMSGQNVTLKSTSAATARVANLTGSTVTGASNVKVERYIATPQRAWHLLSAQAVNSSQTIKDSWQNGGVNTAGQGTWITSPNYNGSTGFDGLSNSLSILIHDQATPSWNTVLVAFTNLGSISARQGYMLFVRGDRSCTPANNTVTPTVLNIKGTLTQGTTAGFTISAAGSGRTLVGNPYASPIDMEPIFAGTANLDQNMMVWDPALAGNYGVGAYRSVVRVGANNYSQTPVVLGGTVNNDPTIQFIPSGSAFFLKASGADANVVFNESNKASLPTTVYNPVMAPTNGQQIIANLMNIGPGNEATLADGIRVRYGANYSASVSDDIEKMGNFNENISSYRNGKKLIVEMRPMIRGNDTIFLRMTNLIAKDYRFQIGALDFVQKDVTAFLKDTYLNTSTPLDITGNINYKDFSVTADAASANPDRFMIIFAASKLQPASISLQAVQQNNQVAVDWKVSNQLPGTSYEVERSTDAVNFSKLNTQTATNAIDAGYNWLDENPALGDNYYRIRSIGTGGEVTLSQPVKVTMGKGIASSILVYPNPVANKKVTVLFTNMDKGTYRLRVINTAGVTVSSIVVNHAGGNSVQNINLPNGVTSGSYKLEVIKPDNNRTSLSLIILQ